MNAPANNAFVPLTATPPPAEPREFTVAVQPAKSAAGETAFRSLESARPAPAAVENKPCEPHVSLQRDGNRVTHIRVQCSCGQILDLACLYEELPAAAPQ